MDYQETIRQLGGFGRLKSFVGAHSFVSDGNMLRFKFKGSKIANVLAIYLTPQDDYTLKFIKIWGTKVTTVKELEGVYCDQLVDIFESTTGLYLSF